LILLLGCNNAETLEVAETSVAPDLGPSDLSKDLGSDERDLGLAPDLQGDLSSPDRLLPDLALDRPPPDVTALDFALDLPSLDAAPDPDEGIYQPPFEPAVCGAPPYSWLPPGELAEVLTWRDAEFSNFSLELIQAALEEEGYEGLEPEYGAQVYKLRYSTQDRGLRREATAMVAAPSDWDQEAPPPVVLWLHGTTGISDTDAPSHDPLEGAAQVAILASLGYLAIAPDYLGMIGFGEPSPEGTLHPYLVAEAVAISSLDALRAAMRGLSRARLSFEPSTDQLIFWGGSQGGHATFFTELYQPYYAPDLPPLAAVAAVPPTDLLGLARWGTQHQGSTTMALSIAAALMWDWYGRSASLDEIFRDDPPLQIASTLFDRLFSRDDTAALFEQIESLEQLFTPAFISAGLEGNLRDLEPWGCYFAENSVTEGSVPRISETPFFVTLSEEDTLVVTEVIREHLPRLCERGYQMEIIECADLSHSRGAVAALPQMHTWIQARVAGEPLAEERLCRLPEPLLCE